MPRCSASICVVAAQHQLLVSWGRSVFGTLPMISGLQHPLSPPTARSVNAGRSSRDRIESPPVSRERHFLGAISVTSRGARHEVSSSRGHEAIPATRNRQDAARAPRIGLQLDPEIPNVAIDHVALRDVFAAPDFVQDLVAGERSFGVVDQHVEEAQLEGSEMNTLAAGADVPVYEVD